MWSSQKSEQRYPHSHFIPMWAEDSKNDGTGPLQVKDFSILQLGIRRQRETEQPPEEPIIRSRLHPQVTPTLTTAHRGGNGSHQGSGPQQIHGRFASIPVIPSELPRGAELGWAKKRTHIHKQARFQKRTAELDERWEGFKWSWQGLSYWNDELNRIPLGLFQTLILKLELLGVGSRALCGEEVKAERSHQRTFYRPASSPTILVSNGKT